LGGLLFLRWRSLLTSVLVLTQSPGSLRFHPILMDYSAERLLLLAFLFLRRMIVKIKNGADKSENKALTQVLHVQLGEFPVDFLLIVD
jgi:hypothetical protein